MASVWSNEHEMKWNISYVRWRSDLIAAQLLFKATIH